MAKIRIPVRLKELTDAEAEWISLVDRPANRLPFRIKKSEEAEDVEKQDRGVNSTGVTALRSAINAGRMNTTSSWSFSASDGNRLLGPDEDQWARFGSVHLAVNRDAEPNTKARWSFPVAKLGQSGITVFRSGLIAARQRAGQSGDDDVFEAAGRLLQLMDSKSEKSAQEKTMTIKVHLAEMLGLRKAEDKEPSVAALIIRKEDRDVLAPEFEAVGFRVDDVAEAGEMIIFKQDKNFDGQDCVYFKANDDVALAIKGENVVKTFHPFLETSSFAESMAAGGFLPTLMIASEAMQDTVRSVLRDSENRKAAVNQIGSVIKEFGDFVKASVNSLPDNAFKCEDITVAKAKAKAKPEEEKEMCPEGQSWNASTGQCEKVASKKTEEDQDTENTEAVSKEEDVAEDNGTEEDTVEKTHTAVPLASLEADVATGEVRDLEPTEDPTETISEGDLVEYDYDDPTYVAALKAHKELEEAGIHVEGLEAPVPPLKKVSKEENTEEAAEEAGAPEATEISAQKAESQEGDADQESAGDEDLAILIQKAGAAGLVNVEKEIQTLGERVENVEKTAGQTRKELDGTVLSDSAPRSETIPNYDRTTKTEDSVWEGVAALSFLDRQ